MAYFDSTRLNWPVAGDINAWADFAETLCMFSDGNDLSIDGFIDFLQDDTSRTSKQLLSVINFNEHFLSVPEVEIIPTESVTFPITGEGYPDEEAEESLEEDFMGDDEENIIVEKLRSRLLRLFSFLEARADYFGITYPFVLTNGISISLNTDITEIHQMYIILLLSSEMQLYQASDRNKLGHLFEGLCKFPFEYLIPVAAKKKFFGAGGGVILPCDYQGNLKDKIISLANDLNIEPNSNVDDPDELGPSGDAGLDWVGFIPFEDNCDHQPIYFGQCACGSNWVDKQGETSLANWRNYLNLNQSLQCFHFMPRSFRRNSLKWFRATKIMQELTLIDRYRLLKIFQSIQPEDLTHMMGGYLPLLNESNNFELD